MERFNPGTMMPDDYLNRTQGDDIHSRYTSLLSGIFTPLALSFDEEIKRNSQNGLYVPVQPSILEHGYSPDIIKSSPFGSENGRNMPQFKEYYVASSLERGFLLPTFIPVDAYGRRFARAITRTEEVVRTLVGRLQAINCIQADSQYGKYINQETFQGNAMTVMQEGIQTIAVSTVLLTADIVDGYEEKPLALFQALLASGILNDLAMRSPNGIIFPLIHNGHFFPHPVTNTENGLILSKELKDLLHEERKFEKLPPASKRRKRGCPLAYTDVPINVQDGEVIIASSSGIDTMAEIFGQYLSHFYHQDTHGEDIAALQRRGKFKSALPIKKCIFSAQKNFNNLLK